MSKKFTLRKQSLAILFALVISTMAIVFLALTIFPNNIMTVGINSFFSKIINNIHSRTLSVFAIFITSFSNPIILAFLSIFLLFYYLDNRYLNFVIFFNLGLTGILYFFLNTFFNNGNLPLNCFPSAPILFAITFYGVLIYTISLSGIRAQLRRILTIIFLNLIVLVCLSRIYLGPLSPSGSIATISISLVYLAVYIYLVKLVPRSDTPTKTDYKKHSVLRSFRYALSGIISVYKEENNLLIQFSVSMLVVLFGVFVKLSYLEWCICILLCFLIMAFEMVNTVMENLCDRITLNYDSAIKKIKDISAGIVLILSICAVIIACIIFLPKLRNIFS